MHRSGWLVFVLVASFAMLPSAWAEDPSGLFLRAFQDFQNAERLEREAHPRNALEKYRSARALLDEISKVDPAWQPLVVEYRKKKIQEGIDRLEPEVARLPPEPEGIEGPLPTQDVERPRSSSSALPTVSSDPVGNTRSTPGPRRTTPQSSVDNSPAGAAARELRDLRKQLDTERRKNSQLAERLEMKEAEVVAARKEIDLAKVNEVEAKVKLAQVTDALDNMAKDGTSSKNLADQFNTKIVELTSRLTAARADAEVLQEENERLLAKLDKASTYITDSEAIRQKLLTERSGLVDARNKAESRNRRIKDNAAQIEKVTADNQKVTTENRELKEKLARMNESMVSKKEYEKLTVENKSLLKKVATAEEAIEAARKSTVSQELVDQLTAENKSLGEKLLQAQKTAEEQAVAAAAAAERDKQIAALQGELNTVNDRLLEAQTTISRQEEQVKNLQKQYDEATGELAQLKLNPAPTNEEKNLISENELLRGIVLRQIKLQTARDEAKQRLEAEIANLKVESKVIGKQLAVLGAPVLQLSPEERNLFKEPIALLSDEGSTMEVAIAVTKPAEGAAPATPDAAATPDALPEDVREMINQAAQLFKAAKTSGRPEQNYAEAEKIYQDIVARVPNNYVALSNLGAVQTEAGKLSAAEVALKKAVDINGKDSFAYTNLGIVYSRQGKFDEAVNSLTIAVALNDNDAVAHNYLGVCLGQKGRREEAEKELKRAIEVNPDYPDAHFNLAVIYATMAPTALDLAKVHYAKATELGAAPDASLERLIQ